MARNHMDELHAKILKKFHTLCNLTGKTTYEKQAIIESYGVESSVDIQTHDLIDICGALQKELDAASGGRNDEMDALRKRCLRCLCEYIDAQQLHPDDKIGYAKQIACRATQRPAFNRITAAELRGVIGEFNRQRKAILGARQQAEISAVLTAQGYADYVTMGEA